MKNMRFMGMVIGWATAAQGSFDILGNRSPGWL